MKGWKTVIFGAIITALGSLSAADFVDLIPDASADIVLAGVGIVIMVLRKYTNTPLGKPE